MPIVTSCSIDHIVYCPKSVQISVSKNLIIKILRKTQNTHKQNAIKSNNKSLNKI